MVNDSNEGECFIMENQSKNPFLMVGSYLGVILFLVGQINISLGAVGGFLKHSVLLASVENPIMWATIINIVLGFLVGWLIHSLIRRCKKS